MYRKALILLMFFLASGFPLFGQQDPGPDSASASSDEPTALQWPREYVNDSGGKLVMYQPQVESWDEYSRLDARAALAYTTKAEEAPSYGALRLSAATETDLESRLVKVSGIEITESSFPSLSESQSKTMLVDVEKMLPEDDLVITLDRVLANLERSQSRLRQASVSSEPPKVFISGRPAILVQFQGEAILSPIKIGEEESELQFVVNTNWDLFFHKGESQFYLRNEKYWLKAPRVTATWKAAGELPEAFTNLPKEDNWKAVHENLPGAKVDSSDIPIIYVSEKPSELIVLDGDPKAQRISGTTLGWVTNTDSDLFVDSADGKVYYLVSGRWFRADSLGADWTLANENLPEDFADIPEDHPRGSVLASVPGTRQAQEAAILAHIPQKATVERDEIAAEVTYDGDPKFEPIEGTELTYAVNTPNDVIRVGEHYYLCHQGVWFVGDTANGPWQAADKVPETIYTIPSSSPVYHTTYVQVYDYGPSWVTYGYTSGYWGVYYSWGSVVYGTGWYYPPYYGYGGYYPAYYAYPVSYGMSAYYNPYTGTFGRGASVYGPYGGAGYGASYSPRTGTYTRGAAAYGPYQSGGWAEAYNPRTGTYARTRQGGNIYNSWGTTGVRRGSDWARTARVSGEAGGAAGIRSSRGNAAMARTDSGLYAGRDGNLYRRSGQGWQQYNNGNWNNVDRSRASGTRSAPRNVDRNTHNQLNRDFQGRTNGAARSQAYSNWRGSGRAGGMRGRGRRR